jgi:hypothetical protein
MADAYTRSLVLSAFLEASSMESVAIGYFKTILISFAL